MSWRIRQDTNANRTTFTPAVGEPFWATDTKKLWIGDGTTAGGIDPTSATPYTELYNVKLFGATGDGVTDDTSAIQDTVDAAVASGGGNVYVPAGVYLISATISIDGDGVSLSGEGTIKRASGFTSASAMIEIDAVDGVSISGITIDGDDGTTDYVPTSVRIGINVKPSSTRARIVGCRITDIRGDGLYIGATGTAPDVVEVSGCFIDSCHRNGISITNARGVTVSACHITDCYQTAIDIEPNDAADVADNIIITGNTLVTSLTHSIDSSAYFPRLIDVSSANTNIGTVNINGNTLDKIQSGLGTASTLHDVAVTVYNVDTIMYSGNSVRTNYTTGAQTFGLVTFRNYGSCVGSGNSVVSEAAASDGHVWGTYKGVYLGFASDPVANINTDFSCLVTGLVYAAVYGLRLLGGHVSVVCGSDISYPYVLASSTNVSMTANGVTAPSAGVKTAANNDTTPTVLGCSLLQLGNNTNPTAITQLDFSIPGQVVVLVATGATNLSTIADSATFSLAGGASWAPATGDTLTLVTNNGGTGATWFEICRSDN